MVELTYRARIEAAIRHYQDGVPIENCCIRFRLHEGVFRSELKERGLLQ